MDEERFTRVLREKVSESIDSYNNNPFYIEMALSEIGVSYGEGKVSSLMFRKILPKLRRNCPSVEEMNSLNDEGEALDAVKKSSDQVFVNPIPNIVVQPGGAR